MPHAGHCFGFVTGDGDGDGASGSDGDTTGAVSAALRSLPVFASLITWTCAPLHTDGSYGSVETTA